MIRISQETFITRLEQIRALAVELIDELKRKGKGHTGNRASAPRSQRRPTAASISFDAPVLAFMNKHARGLNGSQKFTLLLARLAKGNTTTEVSFQELAKRWNKMKTVMGGPFNGAHANRARARGWVDTRKHGVYHLCKPWKESLQADERVAR